ncbi:hypothetical protein RRG08_000131 [Elysia crispata]|uniref:Uncharacterized protein n=1 Tax=Elysia crispata TaxID=231223 RepID=A0AAE0YW52_9GAST|nr:hypothetical protein RRG08_000131 [Elysia crispata]
MGWRVVTAVSRQGVKLGSEEPKGDLSLQRRHLEHYLDTFQNNFRPIRDGCESPTLIKLCIYKGVIEKARQQYSLLVSPYFLSTSQQRFPQRYYARRDNNSKSSQDVTDGPQPPMVNQSGDTK